MPDIQDPQLAANQAALVITESADGGITAAVFYGQEIKQNSISYSVVEQLLTAVVNVAGTATLVEDTTDTLEKGE